MSISSVIASYSIASPSQDTTNPETAGGSEPILTFKFPIGVTYDASSPNQSQKEQYLAALAKALSTLQESVNTGLTERLVQQGVLEEKGDNASDVKNKLRTKVPGQPNNSKKGQTKKQQQREQQEQKNNESTEKVSESAPSTTKATVTPGIEATSLSSADDSSSAMDVELTPSDEIVTEAQELEDQYRPKGGIYGGDDENEETIVKDEVDLVMEADPGEVDGACLELPKEQDLPTSQSNSQTKKRNELPTDHANQDAATAKKSRGADA
ncbi:hypothetical protein FBU30_003234 [Linnemannia zychae]|nr:hypothetical protein FBU30_003234 [Linnemannia zychae]